MFRREAKTLTRSIHFVSVKDGGGTRDTEGLAESLFKKEPSKGSLPVLSTALKIFLFLWLVSIDSVVYTSG